MSGGRYVAQFSNPNVNAGNPQLCDLDCSAVTTMTDAAIAAQFIAFWVQVGFNTMGVGTTLDMVTKYPIGGGVGTVIPFPTTEYAALVTADPTLPPSTAYPVDVGSSSSDLAPLGTSIVISEYTAVGGPGGRGRMFSPFIAVGAVDTSGFLNTTIADTIGTLYKKWLFNSPPTTGFGDPIPVLTHANGSTPTPIVAVRAQPIFSNLESRRR